jgi:FkbM family methyltransferase
MSDSLETRQAEGKQGTLQLQVNGAGHVFNFPAQGNAAAHLQSIFGGKVYQPVGLKNLKPTRIIDIGANVGASAIFFHSRYPDAKIDCFEPSSTNFQYLTGNLADFPSVSLHPFGLYSASEDVTLLAGNSQCLQHSIFPSAEVSANGEQIHLKDAFVELDGIIEEQTLLKIDTEGCELPILTRLKTAFDQLKVIYLEFHSETDRIRIDELLRPTHGLWNATVKFPHRGDVCYVHRSLWENDPAISQWEIRTP